MIDARLAFCAMVLPIASKDAINTPMHEKAVTPTWQSDLPPESVLARKECIDMLNMIFVTSVSSLIAGKPMPMSKNENAEMVILPGSLTLSHTHLLHASCSS